MAKDTFYFSHDYNARNDPKILELRSEFGMEGYGVYWCIIETLAEDNNSRLIATLMGGLSVGYGIPKDRLMLIVDFMVKIGLLHQDEYGYYSERMNSHKIARKLLSDKGRAGADKRWKNSPPISDPNAKKRKEKERIDNELSIITWRNDFNVYKNECDSAFKTLRSDKNFIAKLEYYHPNVNIVKSIDKSYDEYWCKEKAWEDKKRTKTKVIDWERTITNILNQSFNKVYYTKQEIDAL